MDDEYNAYRCNRCEGTGERYQVTSASWVGNQGTGKATCWVCRGRGVNLRLKRFGPHWSEDGELVEID